MTGRPDEPPLIDALLRRRDCGGFPDSTILHCYVPTFPLFGFGAGDSDNPIQLLCLRKDRRQRERAATNRLRVRDGDRNALGLPQGP